MAILEPLSEKSKEDNQLNFQKPILVYMPSHNCADRVVPTIEGIPRELHERIECLIVDNHSDDGTSKVVEDAIAAKKFSFKIHLIRTEENIGYAGSQKLAFSLVAQSPTIKHVIMLHGDGQYPAELLTGFIPFFEQDLAIVNGYRSKKEFPQKEETPFVTALIIKLLGMFESVVLGVPAKEWHSGFVMYSKRFLQKVPLDLLSEWMHIDGEFIMCAHVLNEKTDAIPIFKRYREFVALRGLPRFNHILHVFKCMARYKKKYYHTICQSKDPANISYSYSVLTAKS